MNKPSRSLARNSASLAALTLILLYATVHWGGVVREDRSIYLLALGVVSVLTGLVRAGTERPPRLAPVLRWLLPLLPLYVAFQILPLPAGWVAALSPARGQVLAALGPIGGVPTYASISVFPSGTLQYLLLISGYLLVFLLVRELTWFFADRPWILAVPLVAIAAWQAVLGIAQHSGGGDGIVRGDYVNRNHFAGLLELTLPFAVAYPLGLFRGRHRRSGVQTPDALRMSASWAVAATLLAGIAFSLSRMGFVSAMCSLLVMGVLAVVTRNSSWHASSPGIKWTAVGSVALLVLTTFFFLPPDQLVQRFAGVSANQGIDEGRAELWAETVNLVRAYPIFGCGLGGYQSAFPKYKISGPLVTDDYAHNDYLQVLAEMGILGGSILLGLATIIVRSSFRCALSASDPAVWSLALACCGSLSAILIHSLADFNLYIPANALVVSWVAGIVMGLASVPSYIVIHTKDS